MVQRTPEGVTLNVLGDKELEKAEPTNFVSCVLFLLFVFSSSVVSRVGLFFSPLFSSFFVVSSPPYVPNASPRGPAERHEPQESKLVLEREQTGGANDVIDEK